MPERPHNSSAHTHPAPDAPLSRLAEFLFEVGMLRFTPRSGYAFLGSGKENVAEHSFRAAIIAYALAKRAEADASRAALLCLFHDFAEARTGDLNYVNKRYVTANEESALRDAVAGTGLEADLIGLRAELAENQSLEARLAHDADQLDLLFNLRREQDLGNPYAASWMENVLKRLRTPLARDLAETAQTVDHTDWWLPDLKK